MSRYAGLAARGLSVAVAGLFLARFLAFAGRTVVTPFYPEIGHRFGVDLATASLSLTVFYVGYALFQLPAGWLADRRSPVLLIVLGALAEGAFLAAFAFSPGWTMGLVFRFLGGCAATFLYAPVYKAVQRYSSGHVRGRITGVVGTAVPASMLVTLSLDPILSTMFSPSRLYLIIVALSLLPALLLLGLLAKDTRPSARAAPVAEISRADRSPLTVVSVYVAVGALALALVNGSVGWIPSFLEVGLGLSKVSVGEVIMVQLVSQMAGGYMAGFLSDRLRGGNLLVVRWGTILLPLALAGLWAVSRWPAMAHTGGVWAAEALFGAAHGFATLGCITYANALWSRDSATMLSLMSTVGQVLSIATLEGFAIFFHATGGFTWVWIGAAAVAVIRLPLAYGKWLPAPDHVAATLEAAGQA